MSPLLSLEDEGVDVLSVRNEKHSSCSTSIRDQVLEGLTCNGFDQSISTSTGNINWSKSLPTTILYEGNGIKLYEDITRCSHYYLYEDELSIMRSNGDDIAAALLTCGSATFRNDGLRETKQNERKEFVHLTLLDLGAGRLDKAECLIRSLAKAIRKRNKSSRGTRQLATYCAVDLQYEQLHERLAKLLQNNPDLHNGRFISCESITPIAARAICGSYDDCVKLLRRNVLITDTPAFESCSQQVEHRKCLLWLGSSFTNLKPLAAADFLRKFSADNVLKPGDLMLIGLDRCRNVEKVETAYGESCQCWQDYIRNGVKSAGLCLGGEAKNALNGSENWRYVGRWDEGEGRHMRFARSLKDMRFTTYGPDASPFCIDIKAGENIFFCQSYKYTTGDAELCFQSAGFVIQRTWINGQDDCSLYLLRKE